MRVVRHLALAVFALGIRIASAHASRRRLCRRRWSAVTVTIAYLLLAPLRSEGLPILDQSQLGTTSSVATSPGSITSFSAGQSFTVGITGTLTSIDLYLDQVIGPLEAGLYTATGTPPTLLQSSTMPTFTVAGFYSFEFNYAVTAGDALFFGLALDSGENVQFGANPDGAYAGGAFALFGDSSALSNPFGENYDLAFRTYVEPSVQTAVPEPASLTLLGLGLAGMAGRRWRQRKRA